MGIHITSGGAAQAANGLISANSYLQMTAMIYYMIAEQNIEFQAESSINGYDAAKAEGEQMAKLSVRKSIESGLGAGIQFASLGISAGTTYSKNNQMDMLENKRETTSNMIDKLNENKMNGFKNGGISPIAQASEQKNELLDKIKLPPTKDNDIIESLTKNSKKNLNFAQKNFSQSDIDFDDLNNAINNSTSGSKALKTMGLNDEFANSLESMNPADYNEVKNGLNAHYENYGNQKQRLGRDLDAAVAQISSFSRASEGVVNAFISGFNAQIEKEKAMWAANKELYSGIASSQAQAITSAISYAQGLLEAVRQQSQVLSSAVSNDNRA